MLLFVRAQRAVRRLKSGFNGVQRSMFELMRRLQYLADRAEAEYIISVKAMKAARKRISMFERENLHMCLETGCERPVAGKRIFIHCEAHFNNTEQRWFKDNLEAVGHAHPDEDEHPIVRAVEDSLIQREVELAKKNVQLKERALCEAYETSNAFWQRRHERSKFLPTGLLKRLKEHEQRLIDVDSDA